MNRTRVASTTASRMAYCDGQLRLRAKWSGDFGSAPIPGNKCRLQQLRLRLCILVRTFLHVRRWARMFTARPFLMVGGQDWRSLLYYYPPTYSPPAIHRKPRHDQPLGQPV